MRGQIFDFGQVSSSSCASKPILPKYWQPLACRNLFAAAPKLPMLQYPNRHTDYCCPFSLTSFRLLSANWKREDVRALLLHGFRAHQYSYPKKLRSHHPASAARNHQAGWSCLPDRAWQTSPLPLSLFWFTHLCIRSMNGIL